MDKCLDSEKLSVQLFTTTNIRADCDLKQTNMPQD